MTTWFDAPTFTANVRAKRERRSLRDVSDEIRAISSSTLLRLEHRWDNPEDNAQLIEQALRANGVLSPHVLSAFIILFRTVRQSH